MRPEPCNMRRAKNNNRDRGFFRPLPAKHRPAGRLGKFAKRTGLNVASTKVSAPPAAIDLADTSGHLLLLKIVDRQRDNEHADKQRDHGRQPQGFGFWLHRNALLFPRRSHKERQIVAKLGHPFRIEQIIASETLDCRQGPET